MAFYITLSPAGTLSPQGNIEHNSDVNLKDEILTSRTMKIKLCHKAILKPKLLIATIEEQEHVATLPLLLLEPALYVSHDCVLLILLLLYIRIGILWAITVLQ